MPPVSRDEKLLAFARLANKAIGGAIKEFVETHRPGSYSLADLARAVLDPRVEHLGGELAEVAGRLEKDDEMRAAPLSVPLHDLLGHAAALAEGQGASIDVPLFLSALAGLPTSAPAERRLQDVLAGAGVARGTGAIDATYPGLGYGTDLNRLLCAAPRSPLFGREAELEQVQAELLGGRSPVLVGEPGVGKSALAEGLAWVLTRATDEVPKTLRNLRLVALDVHDLVEDTGFQGALEKRLNALVAHLRGNRDTVPFIDEIHSLLESGKTVSSAIVNKIKQPIARGLIRLIGATTEQEYYATIGRDQALQERLPPVLIGEPSEAEAIEMLLARGTGLLSPETRNLGVRVTPEAVEAAVRLSRIHLPRERLPRKAVQLIAVAAGRKGLALDKGKTDAPALTAADVAAVLADRLRVPVGVLGGTESARLVGLRTELNEAVIGQKPAVEAVLRGLHANLTGLRRPERPLANLVLYGPRGTGRTALCRSLAHGLCGGDQALIEQDMADFTTGEGDAALNRLRGAPPGYRDSGQWNLFSVIRSRSAAVVVFDQVDEIPGALEGCLAQMLDGSANDGLGQPTSFSKCLFVFVAGDRLSAALDTADETARADVLRGTLGPKILARIDAVVRLDPVDDENLKQLLARELSAVNCTDPYIRAAVDGLRADPDAQRELVRQADGRPVRLRDLLLDAVNRTAYNLRADQPPTGGTDTPPPA